MTFIKTVPIGSAPANIEAMYDEARGADGNVPNYVRAFSLRPDVWSAYTKLIKAIREPFDLRRYELVTVAAAAAIGSSYCTLAHGKILSEKVLGAEQTELFVHDYRQADITAAERALVEFVRKVVLDASAVTDADVEGLRTHGYRDVDIFDAAAAATARSFFSRLLDAIGTLPDRHYSEMPPSLRETLTVGRPIEPAAAR